MFLVIPGLVEFLLNSKQQKPIIPCINVKKLFLFLFSFFLFQQTNAQIITGTVIDKISQEKVSYAAIYFSGTFVGTISDINGNFELDVSKNTAMTLSVSCMGYYSKSISDFSSNDSLLIYLDPKDFKVDEIVVSAKSLVRKRKASLRVFFREFIGSSVNAQSCKILNEEDIQFNYDSDTDTLRAFAMKPIQIRNDALGYNITYYLDKFEYIRESKSFIYEGNIIFEEDLVVNNQANRLACETRRRSAYLGSRMHFLRSMWEDELTKAGYSIATTGGKSLAYNRIVVQEAGNVQDARRQYLKYLSYPFPIVIYYGVEVSTMILLKQRVYFEKSGFQGSGIIWEGSMLKKRIGDMLPYEYGL